MYDKYLYYSWINLKILFYELKKTFISYYLCWFYFLQCFTFFIVINKITIVPRIIPHEYVFFDDVLHGIVLDDNLEMNHYYDLDDDNLADNLLEILDLDLLIVFYLFFSIFTFLNNPLIKKLLTKGNKKVIFWRELNLSKK